jgi:hypothetical protein
MARRVLFVTYYRIWPVGQIGVFKRCLRLIDRMSDDLDIHLLHFGPTPEDDPLFRKVAPRLTIQILDGDGLAADMADYFRTLKPHAVVFGECPLAGSMLQAYRTAKLVTPNQIAIDNYSGSWLAAFTSLSFPRIRHWLYLGLTRDGRPGYSGWRFEVAPPLVSVPPDAGRAPRDRICVMGYDRQTLVMACDLLKRLPPQQRVEVFLTDDAEEMMRGLPFDALPHEVSYVSMAVDGSLFASFARAKLLIGKAGFQQIVESLMLGAPIVCQMYDGGVRSILLPSYLRSYVRLVWTEAHMAKALPRIREWVEKPTALPWAGACAELLDPVGYAAGRLNALVQGSQ